MNYLLELDGVYFFEANHFIGLDGNEYIAKDAPPVFHIDSKRITVSGFDKKSLIYRCNLDVMLEVLRCVNNLPYWHHNGVWIDTHRLSGHNMLFVHLANSYRIAL